MHAAQELNSVDKVDKEANRKAKPFVLNAVTPGQHYTILSNRIEVNFVL
jgi:hypothetical protein